MLKLLPDNKTIAEHYKAKGVRFEISEFKRELYRQLGLSSLLERVHGLWEVCGEKTEDFFLIVSSEEFIFRYQYRNMEIKEIDGEFKVVGINKLRPGFSDFNGDDICSFLLMCIKEDTDFTMVCYPGGNIDKDRLIEIGKRG
jgi:hypothetical protein